MSKKDDDAVTAAQALFELTDMLESMEGHARSLRDRMRSNGWSDESSEKAALMWLSTLMGTGQKAAEAEAKSKEKDTLRQIASLTLFPIMLAMPFLSVLGLISMFRWVF